MYDVGREPVVVPVSVIHDPFVVEDLSAPLVPLLEAVCGAGDVEPGAGAPEPLATRVPSPSPDILGPRLRFGRWPEEVEDEMSSEVSAGRPGRRPSTGMSVVSSGSSVGARRLRPRTWCGGWLEDMVLVYGLESGLKAQDSCSVGRCWTINAEGWYLRWCRDGDQVGVTIMFMFRQSCRREAGVMVFGVRSRRLCVQNGRR